MKFIKSIRGKDKGCLNGYVCNQSKQLKSGFIHWTCDQRQKTKCKATPTTDGNRNNPRFGTHPHNHDSRQAKIEAAKPSWNRPQHQMAGNKSRK